MKKVFSLLLACMASITFANAVIVEGTCGANLTWSLNTEDSTLTIEGSGDMYNFASGSTPWYENRMYIKNVSLPQGLTNVGKNAFYLCENLTNIVIPNGVKTIAESAFHYCRRLTEIELPNSVTSIGMQAFCNAGLKSIFLPQNLKSIDTYAFRGCDQLESFSVANNNNYYCSVDGVLYNKNMTSLSHYPIAKQGPYTIPPTVTSLGREAFMGNLYLEEIDVPDQVSSCGWETFRSCKKLVTIKIGSGFASTDLEYHAVFSESNNLESIIVSENNPIYSSEDGILYNKNKSKIIKCPQGKKGVCTIPDNVTRIAYEAFLSCQKITGIVFPNTIIEEMGENAFWGCSGLTEIIIPSNVHSIGKGAFLNCYNLKTVVWDPQYIGDFANADSNPFGHNTSIESFIIGENVSRVSAYLCYRLDNLSSITIPENIYDIGDYAFAGCYNLTSIYNKSYEPQTIYGNVFEDVDKTTCKLIVSNTDTYAHANIWKQFTNIVSIDDNSRCGDNLTWSINLPEKLLTIEGTGAMYEWSYGEAPWSDQHAYIQNVSLPEGLTYISYGAFYECNVTNLTCLSNLPPENGCFSEILPENCTLFINSSSFDNYINEPWWKDFKQIKSLTNEYTVQFIDWDGSILLRQFIPLNSAATPPADPSREGYTFKGWDKDFSNITEDLTVTALYEINRFDVKFLDWDGAILKSDLVDWNTAAVAPANPSREGYTFIGWDKEFGNVTEDLVITAQYELGEKTEFEIQFKDKAGDAILSQPTIIKVPAAPEIAGFTFIGWQIVSTMLDSKLIEIEAVYTADAPTAAPEVVTNPANPAQKLIRNGNVYILTDSKTYTVTGQEVRK